MEKRLLLLRHGEAAQKNLGQSDHARALTKAGEDEVMRTGRSLKHAGLLPEIILASDAVRVRGTVQALLRVMDPAPIVQHLARLYLAGVPELRQALSARAANLRTLMIAGHNPGLSELVRYLSGEEIMLDTAESAYLSYQGDTWDEAMSAQGLWTLEKILPSNLLS